MLAQAAWGMPVVPNGPRAGCSCALENGGGTEPAGRTDAEQRVALAGVVELVGHRHHHPHARGTKRAAKCDRAAEVLDKAVVLCRPAGFKSFLLRRDTDFSLTKNFDRWTEDGVRFVFGYDSSKPMSTGS